MNLKDIMVNARIQTSKVIYCKILFIYKTSRIGKSKEIELRSVVARGWEERIVGVTMNGHGVSILGDEKFWN